jgi:poly(3-hydroxybutyrate) depolymerase
MAAVAQMAEDDDPAQPLSMTLMGGPIHPSANITEPVQLAKDNNIGFFSNLTGHVPFPHNGIGRKVYPGFMQLYGFIMMNQERHNKSLRDYFDHLIAGDTDSATKHRAFYDEYLAVMDMPAEFYLETIQKGFIDEDLANGRLALGGRLIDPSKIKKTAVMTVEGGLDDIAAPGQTIAAHRLLTGLPENMKFAHYEPGAGHYGIFSGSKWRDNIAPYVNAFKHHVAAQAGIQYENPPSVEPQPWRVVWQKDYVPSSSPQVIHLRAA